MKFEYKIIFAKSSESADVAISTLNKEMLRHCRLGYSQSGMVQPMFSDGAFYLFQNMARPADGKLRRVK